MKISPAAQYELMTKIAKVIIAVQKMIASYNNLDDRLQAYVELVFQLNEVLQHARKIDNRYFCRAILMIHDALSCTYSEELTEKQVNLIGSVVKSLPDPDWNMNKLRYLDRQLRECGFETVLSDKFHPAEKNADVAQMVEAVALEAA